ncbi:MAG: MlaD family protein [Nitrosomonas sp.]|nr:MlaD family protein [Nitrosomonas sp.]
MENHSHALIAGIFVIVLSITFFGVVTWFSGTTTQHNNYLVISKESVTGLNPQSSVHYRGVNIGKVESIQFDPANIHQILINISIDQKINLTENVYAQLGYQGVTGLAFIQLNDDGTSSAPLPNSAHIPMRRSLLDEFTGSGKDILSNIDDLIIKMQNLLSEQNQTQITNILHNIETATRDFEGFSHYTQPLLSSFTELTTETSSLVKHIDELLEEIDEVILNANQQGGIIDSLSISTQELAVTIPELRKVTSGFTRNSQNFDRLLQRLEDNPQSLLFGQPPSPPGPGEAGFTAPK